MPSVLIVDDDPVIQLLLKVNFEVEGYDVTVCSTGEGALAHVASSVPQLVLLDVVLPDLSGLEVLKALRVDDRLTGLPVVLMSVLGSDADRKAGIDAGADLYVVKPFDTQRLVADAAQLVA